MSNVVRQENLGLESHLLVQVAVLFKILYFFQKYSTVPTDKYAFPTKKSILIFYFYCQI